MTRIYAPNRIRELRKARRMTQQDVADGLGWETTKGTIAKLENRAMALSLDYILGIAKAIGAQPAEIIDANAASNARSVTVIDIACAGNWRDAVTRSDDEVAVPDCVHGPNLFALRATGSGMNLLVPAGGYVVIDPDDLDLNDGRVYVVADQAGSTTLRRFVASPAALHPVTSDADASPITIGREPFTTIGRAIYACHPL